MYLQRESAQGVDELARWTPNPLGATLEIKKSSGGVDRNDHSCIQRRTQGPHADSTACVVWQAVL